MHALISGISQAVEESNRKMTSSKNNYNSDNFQKFLVQIEIERIKAITITFQNLLATFHVDIKRRDGSD